MAEYFPLSDVSCVKIIKIHDIAFPVYSLAQIQSSNDLNTVKLASTPYNYGEVAVSAPLSFIEGKYKEDVPIALENITKVSKSTSYKYGNFLTIPLYEQLGAYLINWDSDTNFTRVFVDWRDSDNNLIGRTEVQYNDNGNNMYIGSGGYSMPFMFITYNQDSIDYYVRVPLIIRFEHLDSIWYGVSLYQYSSAVDEYARNFFDSNSWVPLTLGQIGGGAIEEDITVNPFEPYPPSLPGTLPPGTFDDTSDPIPDSPLPTLSAANTGFTRIYNPTLSQVQDLANYLWTDESVINTIWNHVKQFFEDPMQAIIGFNLVPCAVPDAGSKEFALMFIKTGVTMNVAANQFVDVECGSVELKRYYGSALDQSPYTKVSCFLPFIGVVSLNTDEVMGTTLSVRYRIDIVSGSCVAKILVDNNVLYQYSGHCAINIPISSSDFSSYVSAAISVAKLSIGYGLAGAFDDLGLTQDPVSQTSTTSTLTTTESNTVRNPSTGRQITSGTKTTTQVLEEQKDTTTTKASYDGLTPANVANTVGQIMGSKPHVEHSGSFNGNTGYLGVRRPYLIIERPNMCLPENYQSLNGFPSMITMLLGECKGYTRVQQVQLTGMQGASINEQSEIQSFLKSGVIF